MTHSGTNLRTKTNLLPETIDQEYLNIINQLHNGKIGPEEYKSQTVEYFNRVLQNGDLDSFIERSWAQKEQLELLRRHLDDRRYTILFYKVAEGEVHPPHHHFNVVSTQIIVRGSVRIREYDRVRRDKNGKLLLKLVSDTVLKEGDVFQASEWHRNVHWFRAEGGPALIFNTNARGFEEKTFDAEEGSFGRRYLDPTQFIGNGIASCDEFGEEEALIRFAELPLEHFLVPEHSKP